MMMSAMTFSAASSLNPDAPMFIPAAFRKVEDYSPEWYQLVKTTAWFRDHWFRQQQLYEDLADDSVDVDDVAALLPDDSVDLLDAEDLFHSPPSPQQTQHDFQFHHYKQAGFGGDMDAVLRTLSLNSPRGGGAPAAAAWSPRHVEKPVQHFGARAGGGARRAIHQPR